jgi:uncharacterized repeat protein (TIGR03833 family)
MSRQGTLRRNIKVGMEVAIVQKRDQKTNKLTRGIVSRILTNSREHPYGIKVKLNNGKIGRVKKIFNGTFLGS